MRLHPTLAAAFCLAAAALAAPEAFAQTGQTLYNTYGITAGVRGGRDFENHAWSAGAQLGVPLGRLEIRPSGDYFFGDRTPFRWQLNADGAIHFGPGGTVYGGGGAAFTRVRALGQTKTGYNLFFGLIFAQSSSRSKPFAEFRWTFVNDTSPFRLVLGVNQVIGRI